MGPKTRFNRDRLLFTYSVLWRVYSSTGAEISWIAARTDLYIPLLQTSFTGCGCVAPNSLDACTSEDCTLSVSIQTLFSA